MALGAVAVLETYWRLPAGELWRVTGTGPSGGASRAFVFLSYSPALASIAVLAIVVDRLDDRRTTLLGVLALLLCATVATLMFVPAVFALLHGRRSTGAAR